MNKTLLLETSVIFDESNIIDCIRQSSIDLITDPSENEIKRLFNKAISYLDKQLDIYTAEELYSLILSFFINFPNLFSYSIKNFLKTAKLNSNHIFVTTSIISYLLHAHPDIKIPDYESFASDLFTQILPQIKKSDNNPIKIFNIEIPPQFKADFITNVILMHKLTVDDINELYPYIFSNKTISSRNLNLFIGYISNLKLLKYIPSPIFIKDQFYLNISIDNFQYFLSILNRRALLDILPQFEEIIIKERTLNQILAAVIILKCEKFDIKFKYIEKVLSYMNPKYMKENIWKYLNKYDVMIPESLAEKIDIFPHEPFVLKLVPKPEKLPKKIISFCLLNATDLDVYERGLHSDNLKCSDMLTVNFWNLILSVISTSEKECSIQLLNRFFFYFEKYVSVEKFNDVFDSLILDNFPLNFKQADFLVSLFDNLKYEYRSSFDNYGHSRSFMSKVRTKEGIPPYTICRLFRFYAFSELEKETNPIILYEFEFYTGKKYRPKITNMKILNQTEKSIHKLTLFVQSEDFMKFIPNLDIESLSFVVAAFYFTSNEVKTEIENLQDDLVLPFIAVSLNYIQICQSKIFVFYDELLNRFQRAFKKLMDLKSSLIDSSIDMILNNSNYLFNVKYIPFELAFPLIEVLLCNFLNGKYNADKTLFLSTIFKLSCDDSDQNIQIKTLEIIQKHDIQLFNYIIQKYADFNHEKLDGYLLNLFGFDTSKIVKQIIDNIENSADENIIINTVCFITKYCKKLPDINLKKKEKFVKTMHKLIDEDKWNELLLFARFMKNNELSEELDQIKIRVIPLDIKKQIFDLKSLDINNIFSDISTDEDPQKNDLLLNYLFKFLMNNDMLAIKYFTILFENEFHNYQAKLYYLFTHLYEDFIEYPNHFLNAFIRSYMYCSDTSTFIKKIDIDVLPNPPIANLIISRLFSDGSYQAFVYLKNIASSFPFIFDENSFNLFDEVLSKINSISSIFDFNGKEKSVENLKRSIAALSLLHSCLHSKKIIQDFVFYLFENILKLNESQTFSMILILSSLFETKGIDMIVLSISIKYNIIDIMMELLRIFNFYKKDLFSEFYKNSIYNLIKLYYNLLNNIESNSAIQSYYISTENQLIKYMKLPLFIDHYQNIKNPFDLALGQNLSIFPYKLQPLKIPFPDGIQLLEPIIQFTNELNELKPFYLNYNRPYNFNVDKKIADKFIEDFLLNGNSVEQCNTNIMKNLRPLTITMLRYVASNPLWIADHYFFYYTLLPEHVDVITKYSKDLIKLKDLSEKSSYYEDITCDFDLEDFKLTQYCNEFLYKYIIHEVSNMKTSNESLFILIDVLTNNEVTVLFFLEFIIQFILKETESKDLFSLSKSIENLMKVISFISKKEGFKNNFYDLIGNKLIEIVLLPKYRVNGSLLACISNVIRSLDIEIPKRMTHLVGFMLTSNESEIIESALEMYSKIDDVSNLQRFLEFKFFEELNNETPSYKNIKILFERVPQFIENNLTKLYSLIETYISLYQKKKDLNLLDLICTLFNFLSPKRNNSQSIIISNSDDIDFSMTLTMTSTKLLSSSGNLDSVLKPAPKVLKKTSPKFWNLYDKHRLFLNGLIEDDLMNLEKFKFLLDYFELVVFRLRSKYFKQKIKNRINEDETKRIEVSRSNILVDSFNELNNLQPKDLLKRFSVGFKGEQGVDAGGLTKEWFTLVVNELFNPHYALFKQTNNQSYQPSSSSYLNPSHIEYFKFAGSLIARALIGGQCVNAHLSVAFLRQILHRKPKLRDMEDYDEELYSSFQYYLENDIDEIDMRFSIDVNDVGEIKSIPLIEDGENIPVTNENKMKYVSLYACYHLSTSIIKQINAFRNGFDAFIPPEFIKIFSPSELDLMICGIPTIDIDDFKANVVYTNPYNEDHPVILMFFELLSKWENDIIGKFLLFLTGSSQIPITGFKDYADKQKPITISYGGGPDKYPVAHTCTNNLQLPEYDDEDDMNDKLMYAIQVCEFGIA